MDWQAYKRWLFANKRMSLATIRMEDRKRATFLYFTVKSAPAPPPTLKERLKDVDWDSPNQVTEWEDCRKKMRDWRNCFICPFKDCINDRPKITHAMNREEEALIERLLIQTGAERKKLEGKKAYYKKNIDKVKEYKAKNKDEIARKKKLYREQNKEKIAAQRKKYREDNKEKIAQDYKKWQEENKEKMAQYNKEYHEKNHTEIIERQKKNREKKKNNRPAPTAPVKE